MHRAPTNLVHAALAFVLMTGAAAACGSSSDQTTTGSTATSAATTASTTTPAGTSIPGSTTTTAGAAGSTQLPGTSTTSTPADGDGGIDPLDGASTTPRTGQPTGSSTALLDSVRVARHEGFDRVVFQFRDHLPGYRVRYEDKPVRSDGPGEVVPLDGGYALVVRMEPASGVDLNGTGPRGYVETYTGPKRIDDGTPEITEVVETGDYEAVLTWAIGTADHVDFRTFALSGPPRLVVDVRNH